MTQANATNGLAILDKPSGWTSHDVVAKSRGLLGTRKVGHAGTLDPMATGVLLLGVGRSTKLLQFLSGLPKTYEATIRLGIETDSLDADGEVTASHEMAPPTLEEVRAAARSLTGDLMQVPPMVSAIKVDGRRLHQLAREGKEVHREPRPVTVSRFAVSPGDDPMTWRATIDCSSGTYVRVLAADLGRLLQGGAHLAGLRRTSIGPFGIAEAQSFEQAISLGEITVAAPETIARVLEEVSVDDDMAAKVAHGSVFERHELTVGTDSPGPWALMDSEGSLLAVYEAHSRERVKPAMVMIG